MIDAIIKGITLGLLLAISVGPIVFTVIKQSLNNGIPGGFAFIAGISVSDIMLVVLSNFFTNLFEVLKTHKAIFAIVASCLLIVIGVYYLFFKKAKIQPPVVVGFNNTDYVKIFAKGFGMNLINPGIIVFWLTTATTFIDHTLNMRVLIFTIALLIALLADVFKVLLANKIRKKLTPKNIHLINQINGGILIGFGILIIFMQ